MKRKIVYNAEKIEINNKSNIFFILAFVFGLAFIITLYFTLQYTHNVYRIIAPIGAIILYVIFIFNNARSIQINKGKIILHKLVNSKSIETDGIEEIKFKKSKTSNDIYMYIYLKNGKMKRVMIFMKPAEVDLADLNDRVAKLIGS